MENPSYFSILTADVRYDKTLIPAEKIMFSEITALANKSGYCNATNSYFVKLYDAHKDTISRWINDLKSKNYLKVEMIYKGKRIVERRIYPIGINADRYRHECPGGIGINAEENNTSINNKEEEKESSVVDFYNNNIGMITPFIFEDMNSYLNERNRREFDNRSNEKSSK